MDTKNEYNLPVEKKYANKRGTTNIPTHVSELENAVDFFFTPEGSNKKIEGKPIFAAAEGEVVKIKDDSDEGGWDKKYIEKSNFVMIKHPNGEFSWYEHLKYKGVTVKVGDHVKAGQVIGYSGNTGLTKVPHLHFHVLEFYGPGKDDYRTLKVKFKEDK